MISHIVMWAVKGDTARERLVSGQRIREAFEGLRGLIPGMVHVKVGLNCVDSKSACDVVLITEFESAAALHDYAQHPEHLRVRNELAGLRLARYSVDYEIRE